MEQQQYFVARDLPDIDVLDENLYCYENAIFTLTPAIQTSTSETLLGKVEHFINSAPAVQKAAAHLKSKTEYIPRFDLLSDEIKKLLREGKVEIIPRKDSTDTFFLQIRSAVKGIIVNGKEYAQNKKIKDIPLSTKNVPADITGAMQCLSMQRQLNQIADVLKEISEACEFNFGRIIQGQRDDRLAKLLSSRSCFIQALALSDKFLQQQMLMQALHDANTARAELAFQIKSDIILLGGEKAIKSKQMEKTVHDINVAVAAMNGAVQISLYSYQALGEHIAQLAAIKEHETFLKQVLLREITYMGNNHIAWDVICSSGNSGLGSQNIYSLPTKLITNCTAFIENKNKILSMCLEDECNG